MSLQSPRSPSCPPSASSVRRSGSTKLSGTSTFAGRRPRTESSHDPPPQPVELADARHGRRSRPDRLPDPAGDSLSASLEAAQQAHQATVETANENAAEAVRLSAEITRMNAILSQREAVLTASRSQINAAKRAAMEAKNGDQDAPAAPLWNGVPDGLYGPSNHAD